MIRLENISLSFNGEAVFKDFSLEIGDGITAITGASGCGKTTLLRIIAGLQAADSGTVTGTDGLKTAFVFAEPRLLPWYNVEANIALVNPELTGAELKELSRLTETEGFLDKMPRELSAGMAQRASIARALAYKADILLMDEPFKALDFELKDRIITRIAESFSGKAMIFITHERYEAEKITEKIISLSPNVNKL